MTTSRTALALVAAVALGACADAPRPTTAGPTTSPPATTPTTAPPVATPTGSPRATPLPSATALPTDLADGKHYAYLVALAPKLHVVRVDVAQFLTGEAAEQAAKEDGEEAFDYYVRNQNPRLRELKMAETVKIVTNTLTASESGSSSKDVAITLEKLASFMQKGQAQKRLFWFRLEGGFVVRIQEQYLP